MTTTTTTTVTADAKSMTTNLAFLRRALGRKNPRAIAALELVRVAVTDGVLTLTVFNYETAVTVRMATEADTDVAEVLTDLTALTSAVKSLGTKGTLTLAAEHGALTLTLDGASVTVPLAEADVPDLPTVPAGGPVAVLSGADLAAAAVAVGASIGTDDTLPMLTGVKLESDGNGEVIAAATDRFKLTAATLPTSNVVDAFDVLLPGAVTLHTAKLGAKDDAVTIRLAPMTNALGEKIRGAVEYANTYRVVEYTTDTATVVTRVLDAEFPRFRGLLPSDDDVTRTVVVDAATLAQRAKLMAKSAISVRFHLDAEKVVTLTGHTSDGEQVSSLTLPDAVLTLSDWLPDAQRSGEYVCAFSADYLGKLAAAAPRGEKVTLRFTTPARPCGFRWTNTDALLMPVRLPSA